MTGRGAMDAIERGMADEYEPTARGFHRFYIRHEYAVVYVVAGVSYVAIGIQAKFLLNWIVGPLWPVVFMWFGPSLVRRVTGWQDPLP